MEWIGIIVGLLGVAVAAIALGKSGEANRIAKGANTFAEEANGIAREANTIAKTVEQRAIAAEKREQDKAQRGLVQWKALPRREVRCEWELSLKNVGEAEAHFARINDASLTEVAVRGRTSSMEVRPGETLDIRIAPPTDGVLPNSVEVEWSLESGSAEGYTCHVDTSAWQQTLPPSS